MLLEETSTDVQQTAFAIDDFLRAEEAKDLLRFSTAGSVDDGKSTLIGRLLYDSRNVYEDQVRAVTGAAGQGGGPTGATQPTIDFALLTDGLRAEREQGITIDVAYRYFATAHRKFIIADTPGHEQYTRNMATGASTADLAIVLIDARKGILPQSRRHAYIASLLGIRHIVAAVNKMDLVGFSEEAFRAIERDIRALVRGHGNAGLVTIPVSALEGDNVVERSARTPWYTGPTLLEHLEQVPVWTDLAAQPFRMPVQRVSRPGQHFRGFAGQIASGTIRPGDTVVAHPSGRTSRVASISTFDGDLDEATAPLSVTLTLDDELDISRGDLLASPLDPPRPADTIEASVVWFAAPRLETHAPYLLKHGAATTPARVTRVLDRTDIHTLAAEAGSTLGMNDIGTVEIELSRSIFFDPYTENRVTGSFILIDPHTDATLAAGMIRSGGSATSSALRRASGIVFFAPGASDTMAAVERELLAEGIEIVRTASLAERTLRGLLALGLVVLVEGTPTAEQRAALAELPMADAADFLSPSTIALHLLQARETRSA